MRGTTQNFFLMVFSFVLTSHSCALYAESVLDEIIVTAAKNEQHLRETTQSISVISNEDLTRISHTHIAEALQRVPGVWISRGNGQEHLTAIRSPVLTGAGSCGAFIMAQNGISLRAPGFCNVNELFEASSELANKIEVVRGPGSSIYGSNALHGVINILTPAPAEGLRKLSFEAGPNDYLRTKTSWSTDQLRLDFSGTTDGGYKDASGFDQQKLLVTHSYANTNREITTTFSYTNLNQETAGFIRGDETYKDSGSKRDNPNPEAYRDARSFRLMSVINQQLSKGAVTLTPYLRSVDMTFLQHFLPGQAIEKNGHDSLGLHLLWHQDSWWQLGFELEYTDGFLDEAQPNPTQGSAFLAATIPAGKHYDYDVTAALAGVFLRAEHSFDQLTISGSLRYQHTKYDYNNNMASGRNREDGTPCGFGGCRFNRPDDSTDTFNNWSPNLGFTWNINPDQQFYGSLSRGFRAPQATELYRLQARQNIADIDPVELDAIELGLRGSTDRLDYAISIFSMDKDNFIFRDTSRSNVDNGKTKHQGAEVDVTYRFNDNWSTNAAFTLAEHEYRNNPTLSATPLKGNTVDTAPETLGSLTLLWQATPQHTLELEWVHLGEYFEDPQNLNEYEGHDLLHLRGDWHYTDNFALSYRIMNLTDEDYAERADFAFGSDRYFVGTPRSIYLGFRFSF
jgi:iron complex outermembrane receptor protein